MSDERNFRTYYYDKFGISGVEERKSLEILLKEKPISVEKLKQFCLRFAMPVLYRNYVWKLILDILCANPDGHKFLMQQRSQKYNDLHHAVKLLRYVHEDTPIGKVFLKMYLVESGQIKFEQYKFDSEFEDFVSIASTMADICDDMTDAYLFSVEFYKMFIKSRDSTSNLVQKTIHCLKSEDGDGKLFDHFKNHDLWSSLPLPLWFNSCFARVLPETSIERIWDKVVGGAHGIVVYVAVAIFLTFKRPLLSMKSREDMLHYLMELPEDCGDIIVTKAIDLWSKHS
ncbi:TBC1 domain family member 7-like isoform X2 [Ostrea edulis]|uniref:TBC1 domain family member 7-like isoform X2 n=1 Tax=Ostrea edulis TaxID=37623 RepID=UPI0020945B0D|nr:TBC1 domain family member 7-like isoform X2 [Ostrea edulis]